MSQCLRGQRSLSRLCKPVGSLVGTFCFDLFLICTRYGNICDAALAVKASDSAMLSSILHDDSVTASVRSSLYHVIGTDSERAFFQNKFQSLRFCPGH